MGLCLQDDPKLKWEKIVVWLCGAAIIVLKNVSNFCSNLEGFLGVEGNDFLGVKKEFSLVRTKSFFLKSNWVFIFHQGIKLESYKKILLLSHGERTKLLEEHE